MNCPGCGKSLSTEELRGDDCQYCGKALPHRAEAIKQSAVIQEVLRDSDGDGVPDALAGTHLDPSNRPATSSSYRKQKMAQVRAGKKSRGGCGCVFPALGVLATLAGLIFSGVIPTPFGDDLLEGLNSVITEIGGVGRFQQACWIDANGDGVQDIAGKRWSGDYDRPNATVVDGASGSVLWTSETYESQIQVRCLSDQWFVAAQENFQIDFYDSRKLGPPVRVMASDELSGATLGEGCVALRTKDRKTAGVSLPGGVSQDCAVEGAIPRFSRDSPGVIGLTDDETHFERDGKRYHLTERQQGTEILRLKVIRGDEELLNQELPYQKPTFGAGVAAAEGRVMVLGAKIGAEGEGLLIGLDEETGKQLYERPIDTNNPDFMGYNGRYVVIQYGATLAAFDIQTGSRAW